MSDEKIKFEKPKADTNIELYQKLKKALEEDAVGVVSAPFQETLEKFPELEAIVWTQYAP